MNKNWYNLLSACVGIFTFTPILIWARDTSQIDYPNILPGFLPNLPNFINIFYIFALAAGALIFFYILVTSGFKYFLSSGAPKVWQAIKNDIWSVIIGLLILFGASLILAFINPRLTQLSIPGLQPTISPRKFNFSATNSTTTFLVIPVGQIIEEGVFSKGFMLGQAKMLSETRATQNTRATANKLAQDLYFEIKNCQCGAKEENSCPKASCNTARIAILRAQLASIVASLKIQNEQNKTALKNETESLSVNPRFAFNQLALIASLLKLAGPENIENYYSFLALRENSGQNQVYYITTTSAFATSSTIFKPWGQFWERKKFDPMTFYIQDSSSTAKLLGELSKIKKTLNIDPFSPAKNIDPNDPPDKGDGFYTPPDANYYFTFKQIGKSWSECKRGFSSTVGNTGCADMSLAIVINYWYRRDGIVRQRWDNLLQAFPPPRSFTDYDQTCADPDYNSNRTDIASKIPRPYDILYYMSNNQFRINQGDWNVDHMREFLNIIGLNFYTIKELGIEKGINFGDRLDFDEAKTILNDYGYSIVLFCDLFGDNRTQGVSGHRDCSGGDGSFVCNHYVAPTYVTNDGIMHIKDPAAWFGGSDEESGYSGMNRFRYDAWQCGEIQDADDQPFIVFPRSR